MAEDECVSEVSADAGGQVPSPGIDLGLHGAEGGHRRSPCLTSGFLFPQWYSRLYLSPGPSFLYTEIKTTRHFPRPFTLHCICIINSQKNKKKTRERKKRKKFLNIKNKIKYIFIIEK